jgi:hypothetical protein
MTNKKLTFAVHVLSSPEHGEKRHRTSDSRAAKASSESFGLELILVTSPIAEIRACNSTFP